MLSDNTSMAYATRNLAAAIVAASSLVLVDAEAAGRIFYDGFESGNSNLWISGQTYQNCEIVTSSVDGVAGPYAGSYMAMGRWGSGIPNGYTTLVTSMNNYTNEVFIRVRVRPDMDLDRTANSGAKILRSYINSNFDFVHEFKKEETIFFSSIINGYQPVYYGMSGDNSGSPLSWHKIELYINRQTGAFRVWHDELLVYDVTHNYNGQKFSNFELLSNWGSSYDGSNHVYFDEVEIFTDNGSGASGSMSDGSVSASASAAPSPPSDVSVR